MKKAMKWIGALFLLGLVVQGIKATQQGTQSVSGSANSVQQAQVAPSEPAVPLPDDQDRFIRAVQKAQAANRTAENDMQRGGALAAREKEICSILPQLRISNWLAEVYSVSSNSDGKGVLVLTLSPNIYVKTWNNALSDIQHHTMIEPNTDLFNKASQLKEGQKIKFSGSFVPDVGDSIGCLYEGSLSLDGKLSEPEFIVRFEDVTGL